MRTPEPDPDAWCSVASAWSDEPMPGTAPHADVWVVVEQQEGWGRALLARTEHGVRVVMARPLRGHDRAPQAWIARCAAPGPPPLPDASETPTAGFTGPVGDPSRPATTPLASPMLRRGPLDDARDVAGWDLGAVAAGTYDDWGDQVAEPLLLICANGRRDRCCGHVGGRLAREIAEVEDAGAFLTCTHLGGHRFAPTALLLPWGALHGRLNLDATRHLVAEARAGRAVASSLRGYSTLSAPAQVAEAHARKLTGHHGLPALAVRVDPDPTGDHARADVALPSGETVTLQLRREVADVLPSCGKHLESTPRWVVVP